MSINNNCIICLEEGKLIEYNHCGTYYVHQKCLNKWKSTECFICRKSLIQNLDIESDCSQNSEQTNDIQIVYYNNSINRGTICILAVLLFTFCYLCYVCFRIVHIKKHHGSYEIEIYFE